MKNKLLTVREYAIAEGMSTAAIYNRIRRGKLQSTFKHGLRWVFPDTDKTIKKPRDRKYLN